MAAVLFCFELGYVLRFAWDKFLEGIIFDRDNVFLYVMIDDLVAFSEGMSLFTLLNFHRKNFTQNQTVSYNSFRNTESDGAYEPREIADVNH